MVLIVYSFKIFAVIFTTVIVPTSSSYDGSQKVYLICRVTFYLSLIKLDCRLAQFLTKFATCTNCPVHSET